MFKKFGSSRNRKDTLSRHAFVFVCSLKWGITSARSLKDSKITVLGEKTLRCKIKVDEFNTERSWDSLDLNFASASACFGQ